jgi:hypothetical protein
MKLKKLWLPISAYLGSGLAFVLMFNFALIFSKIDLLPENFNGVVLLLVAILFFIDPLLISTGKKLKPRVMLYIFFWGIAFSFFSIGFTKLKDINYFPIGIVLITILSFGFAHNLLRYDFVITKKFYAKVYFAILILFVELISLLS